MYARPAVSCFSKWNDLSISSLDPLLYTCTSLEFCKKEISTKNVGCVWEFEDKCDIMYHMTFENLSIINELYVLLQPLILEHLH
jgi:hypothetical protein